MQGSLLEFEVDAVMDINRDRLRQATGLSKNLREYEALVNEGQVPYPNNFDLCTIRILDESVVLNGPSDLSDTDCASLFAVIE